MLATYALSKGWTVYGWPLGYNLTFRRLMDGYHPTKQAALIAARSKP